MTAGRILKRALAKLGFVITRTYVRYSPVQTGRQWIWEFARDRVCHYGFRQVARARFGGQFYCSSGDLVQSCILFFGEWQPSLTSFLVHRLQPGDVFVDVGANIGYFTLLASKLVGPTGRVVAIDASASNFSVLSANARLNKAENVRSVHAAVMSERGVITTFFGDEGNCGHASVLPQHGTRLEGHVEAFPLNDLLATDEWTRARIIKIDVEGAEADVLKGILSGPTLGPDTDLIVEINPEWLTARGESAGEILSAFRSLGYYVYELNRATPWQRRDGPLLREVDGPIERQADIIFSRTRALERSVGEKRIATVLRY